jgi:hypothetical protein
MSCLLLKEQRGQVFVQQNFDIFPHISVFFEKYQPVGTESYERHPCKYLVAFDLAVVLLEQDPELPQQKSLSLLEALLIQQ